jgi:hemerythrin superfamily protein
MILETLQTDHRQVKELLETILSTDDAKKRGGLFKQFRTELTSHSRAEEKVLYRRMEKSEEGKDDALEGAVEHEAVDRLMEDLSRSRSVGSDKWTARCTVLQELLRHHIDEEEGEFFKDCSEDFRSPIL